MKIVRVCLVAALVVLLGACSALDKAEVKEVITADNNNPLTFRDILVATFINAPKPKVGIPQEDFLTSISLDSILILH
ncbi:hypothetical protein AB6T38_14270 [Aliiglaciecola sp. SL4]|uniref:hypothetical protein n=1 Tax=Aliiglaciecola sp. SL4 TaxID=3239806 RepID=UPI00355B0CDB